MKTLASCEGGILPWVGSRAAAGPWLVGVPQLTSWFSHLPPNKPPLCLSVRRRKGGGGRSTLGWQIRVGWQRALWNGRAG